MSASYRRGGGKETGTVAAGEGRAGVSNGTRSRLVPLITSSAHIFAKNRNKSNIISFKKVEKERSQYMIAYLVGK